MADDPQGNRPGGTIFLTLRLARREDDTRIRHVEALRCVMRDAMARGRFRIDAITVLPAAIHALWTLPPGDADLALRVDLLKARFARHVKRLRHFGDLGIDRGEKDIWQQRFRVHRIVDRADFDRQVDPSQPGAGRALPKPAGLDAQRAAPRRGRCRAVSKSGAGKTWEKPVATARMPHVDLS